MSWRQNLLGYEENIGVVCIFVWWLSVVFCRGHILPRGVQVCLLSTLSRGTNITERRTCMFVFSASVGYQDNKGQLSDSRRDASSEVLIQKGLFLGTVCTGR